MRIVLPTLLLSLSVFTVARARDGETPHVVLIGGDAEYSSRETVDAIAASLRERWGFRTTVLKSHVGSIENPDNPNTEIPGLEAIRTADLLIIYVRMRKPPREQLQMLDAYFAAGKPAIGLRTTTHGFTNDRGWCPRYFGGHYWTHFGGTTTAYTLPSADDHPILRGLPRHRELRNSLYVTVPLSDTATPLVLGRHDEATPPQVYAWTNEYCPGSRLFFSTMSHPEDIADSYNQTLLYNAVFWCLGREVPEGGVLGLGKKRARTVPVETETAPPADAPPGAVVLFGGDDLSRWDWWFGGKEGLAVYGLDERAHSGAGLQAFDGPRWRVVDRSVEAAVGRGDLITREPFTDYRLHLEFLVPPSPKDAPRLWRGNSGVFLNGSYEVQILEGDGSNDVLSCGAITGQVAPAVDAARGAGEWQSLDITFRAARFRGGKKASRARVTALLNGKKIHDNVALADNTTWGLPEARVENGPVSGPIRFQADSGPVRFRNIWVEPLSFREVTRVLPDRRPPTGKPWIDMDYGQFLTASIEVSKGNIAHKGVAIRLDGSEGGISSGSEFVVFDTDTLRYAAGWVGPDFIDWRSIVFDGSHQTHPRLRGDLVFSNPIAPGWGKPGEGGFEDPRVRGRDGVAYGPLPRSWARWKGLYVYGDQVVLSYSIGGVDILERPLSEINAGVTAFIRTLDIGLRPGDLMLQVAHDPEGAVELHATGSGRRVALLRRKQPANEERAATAGVNFDGTTRVEIRRSEDFDFSGKDFSVLARIKTRKGGTILASAPARGEWKPDGVTFFVRGGRLCYDIGWVGVVQSRRRVADGEWHDVLLTFDSSSGVSRLYVDGELDGERSLRPQGEETGHRVRIGYTSPDFPDPSSFVGSIEEVRFYQRRVDPASPRVADGLVAHWRPAEATGGVVPDLSGNGRSGDVATVDGAGGGDGADSGILAATLAAGPEVATWVGTPDGHLRLRIPAGEPTKIRVVLTRIAGVEDAPGLAAFASKLPPPADLKLMTAGGEGRWKEVVKTQSSVLGRPAGPYVVDTITAPDDNPWDCWMRLGGFDFFPDGKRAAVCTWMGDVWTVDGLGAELGELTWRRIAGGLYQPLGLKIVGGVIHVLGRDQITRLHDLDGDGETDFYENFNNDAQATEHFHEFASGLQTDAAGNFYYMKGGRHALDSVTPQHGSLIRVSADGSRSEMVAYGFRAPNGLCVNPNGSFIGSDQEGHWTPANRINWIEPGSYSGYQWSGGYHANKPEDWGRPLCWIHPEMDRSPAEQLWVTSDRWGPLGGGLLSLSYGTGHVYLVPWEEVDGRKQGGVVKLPIEIFPTGVMRGRFHPGDGQLYVCGLFGWSSNRTKPGGLYRVRWTGRPVHAPVRLHATTDGVLIVFSDPLDRRRAGRAGSYVIEQWNYRRTAQYGSKEYRVSDGSRGRDQVAIESVRVSEDGRSVFLAIPDMKPCMQMRIRYRLRGADGSRISQDIYNTVHALGDPAPLLRGF